MPRDVCAAGRCDMHRSNFFGLAIAFACFACGQDKAEGVNARADISSHQYDWVGLLPGREEGVFQGRRHRRQHQSFQFRQ